MNGRLDDRRHGISLALGLAAFAAFTLPRLDYVPLWDSMENLELYLFKPRPALRLGDLLVMHNGHPAWGYFWPFWLAQVWFPSEMLAVHLINLSVGALAVFSFNRLLVTAFGDRAHPLDLILGTVAFAIHPIVVVHGLNMTPDYGVLAYFLTTLWSLQTNRLKLAAVAGTLLVGSKEMGVACFGLCAALYIGNVFGNRNWKKSWVLGVPLLAFAAYCAHQLAHRLPVFPFAETPFLADRPGLQRWIPDPFASPVKMVGLMGFVLHFQWVFFAATAAALISHTVRAVRDGRRALDRPLRSYLLLLMGVFYLLTRVLPFSNPRYVITLYPLVLILFVGAMLTLALRARLAMCAVGCLLLLASNFRTLDPVSRSIVETFSFGEHPILKMTSVRGECCEYGRDQWMYNLEHTHLDSLLNRAMAKIAPDRSTMIIMPNASWFVVARLDPKTFRRTESTRRSALRPHFVTTDEVMNAGARPAKVYVMTLPYIDPQPEIQRLSRYYRIAERHRVEEDGYALDFFEMRSGS